MLQHRCLRVASLQALKQRGAALQVRSAADTSEGVSDIKKGQGSSKIEGEGAGVKATLFKLLAPVKDPITAEDLWQLAQGEGLKSKRFMKDILDDLRKRGKITSKPARGKSFGYILPTNWAVLKNAATSQGKGLPTVPNPPKSRAAI